MSFDSFLPILAEKWREVPGGSDLSQRVFSNDLLGRDDTELLNFWEGQYQSGIELRIWWWRLYENLFKDKNVLEIGSGLGFDAVHFASCGAKITCCDVAPTNLGIISRIASTKDLEIETVAIDSLKSFEHLRDNFDFVWCNGSLINLPFELARGKPGHPRSPETGWTVDRTRLSSRALGS